MNNIFSCLWQYHFTIDTGAKILVILIMDNNINNYYATNLKCLCLLSTWSYVGYDI